MSIGKYLGAHISEFLSQKPFKDWEVERSTEDDLEQPIINYVFPGQGLQLRCDQYDKISVIFLDDRESDFDIGDCFGNLSFSHSRENVLSRFGRPSKSGEKRSHPVLGDYGPWDRFVLPSYTIHVEYQINSDLIKRITIMREDVVPG